MMKKYIDADIWRAYKMLRELHGINIEKEVAINSIAEDLGVSEKRVEKVLFPPPEKFGVVMGRFQPFHFGHQHIINEIILDGRVPVILMGDDQGKDPKRNPLSVSQRTLLIQQVFPNICVYYGIKDNEDWDEWFKQIKEIFGKEQMEQDAVFYYYNKEQDRYDYFECNGRTYYNEFFTSVFEDYGFKMKEVEFVSRSDIKMNIHANSIRDDIEYFKHFLDGRNYWTLKEWGW
jgi:nicotinamide mononucleotide adenylyltransferase